ncbi:hypothetical protein TNCV_3570631 [Trichonephila clavipes]|nr:hypothetical protein TNCV_3570631 [Trichonephila clavipes]
MTLQCKSRFGKSVSPETPRNVLRKHKYHGRVPQRKPYTSKANGQARLAFAKMYDWTRIKASTCILHDDKGGVIYDISASNQKTARSCIPLNSTSYLIREEASLLLQGKELSSSPWRVGEEDEGSLG